MKSNKIIVNGKMAGVFNEENWNRYYENYEPGVESLTYFENRPAMEGKVVAVNFVPFNYIQFDIETEEGNVSYIITSQEQAYEFFYQYMFNNQCNQQKLADYTIRLELTDVHLAFGWLDSEGDLYIDPEYTKLVGECDNNYLGFYSMLKDIIITAPDGEVVSVNNYCEQTAYDISEEEVNLAFESILVSDEGIEFNIPECCKDVRELKEYNKPCRIAVYSNECYADMYNMPMDLYMCTINNSLAHLLHNGFSVGYFVESYLDAFLNNTQPALERLLASEGEFDAVLIVNPYSISDSSEVFNSKVSELASKFESVYVSKRFQPFSI